MSPKVERQRAEPRALEMRAGDRASQVMDFAIEGLSDREMAERLGISVETVGSYWRRLFERFGWNARTAAVAEVVWQRCLADWRSADVEVDPSIPDPRHLGAYSRGLAALLPEYLEARRKRSIEPSLRVVRQMLRVHRQAFLDPERLQRAAELGKEPYIPKIVIPKDPNYKDLDTLVSDLFLIAVG